jgi:plasmid stabilization system protein ParE
VTSPVEFRPIAQFEVQTAFRWYRLVADELADRFLAEVRAATARIAAGPQHYAVLHRDIRVIYLRGFPYGLFFRVRDDAVYVVACFHTSQNPSGWKRRP